MECTEDPNAEIFEKGNKFAYGSCPQGNGSSSVMIIGNSYSMSLRHPIRSHFHNNYSDFRYISLQEGFAFFSDTDLSHRTLEVFKKQVELHKPDVLFIITKLYGNVWNPIHDNDDYVRQMNENIAFYEQFTKRIVILSPHPHYRSNFANYFLQYVVSKPDEVQFLHLNKREADHKLKNVKKRLSLVNCTKCHFFDLSHVFVDNDKYLTFDSDEMLTYVDNTGHISSAGLELCDSVFETVIRDVLNTL
ncbi:unnamed protein product [Caenorhabditis brenneri]